MKQKIIIGALVISILLSFGMGFYVGKKTERNKHLMGEDTFTRFYATILEVDLDTEIVLVEGIKENDINHRGKAELGISRDTVLLSKQKKEISLADLREGELVLVVYHGNVLERGPVFYESVDALIKQ